MKKNLYLIICLLISSLFATIQQIEGTSKMPNYLYDLDQVRYELYQTNEGKNYNWLFFPGGPGGDSCYLHSLVDELQLPGNVWLIQQFPPVIFSV